jgi:hypothetical protein
MAHYFIKTLNGFTLFLDVNKKVISRHFQHASDSTVLTSWGLIELPLPECYTIPFTGGE